MKRNNRSKNRYLPQDRITMRLADRYGMTEGYKEARRKGYTPLEAGRLGFAGCGSEVIIERRIKSSYGK